MYDIPGGLFQVPTAFVWIFTARLVTGKGLPPMAKQWAMGSGVLFSVTTIARIVAVDMAWRPAIPGGIAVAVGMTCPRHLTACPDATNSVKGCTTSRHSRLHGLLVGCLAGTGLTCSTDRVHH